MILSFVVGICYLWLILSFTALLLLSILFRLYRHRPTLNLPPKYRHTIRQDPYIWQQQQLIRGCFTRFPLNATLYFSCIILCWLFTCLRLRFNLTEQLVHRVTQFTGQLAFRTMFELQESVKVRQDIDTALVVANHSSEHEVFYMFTHFNRPNSFIAKKGIDTLLFYGTIGLYFLKNIYVDRAQRQSRREVKRLIQQRIDSFRRNPSEFPLVIFPESTVASQHGLLKFKNGPFQPMVPLTLLSFRFQCPQFQIYTGEVSHWRCLLSTLCLRPKMRVSRSKIEPQEGESVEEYRQRCRVRMAQMGGLELSKCTVRDVHTCWDNFQRRRLQYSTEETLKNEEKGLK